MFGAGVVLALILFLAGLLCEGTRCQEADFDEAMAIGVRLTRMNDYGAALPCFERACSLKQKNAGALLYFGEACLKTGRLDEAIRRLTAAQKLQPAHVTGWLLLASAKQKAGDNLGAINAYETALQFEKDNVAALVNGGTVLREMGQAEAALAKFDIAIKVAPHIPEGSYNLGDLLLAMDRHAEALAAADATLRLSPSMSAAHILKVLALEGQQRFEDAVRAAERGLAMSPSYYGLLYEHARMLRNAGRLVEAEAAFKKCTSGNAKSRTQGWRAATMAYAHNEYAHLLSQMGRHPQAKAQWRRSIEVDPSFAQGWVNSASHEDGVESSLAMYTRAVALSPGLAEGWINIGQVYYNNFRADSSYMRKALDAFERARAAAPGSSSAVYSLARTRVDLCMWDEWDLLFVRVASLIRRDLERGLLLSTSLSLVYLLVYPIPDDLLHAAYAARAALARKTAAGLRWRGDPAAVAAGGHENSPLPPLGGGDEDGGEKGGKIVVGYLSPDLKEHPVGLLFHRVPGLHDKSRFRVILFPLLHPPPAAAPAAVAAAAAEGGGAGGGGDRGAGGDRVWGQLAAAADEVVDLTDAPAAAAAREIAARRVDVLVDMAGYTQHGRPELLAAGAAGAARAVVSMLGFAGSLRGAGPDAAACDSVACPPEFAAADFSESLMYLPGTFYLADHLNAWHTRRLAAPGALPAVRKPQVTGLRAGSFVYASFNQPFKIDPETFALWMRILIRVPGSQIWIVLLNEGAQAEPALRAEARRHGLGTAADGRPGSGPGAGSESSGIEDWRLVFTGSAELFDHVAYKSAADLMLDTRLYNAHSTAADTLFAGVPVLTLPGRRMVSRVGASIAAGAGQERLFVARGLAEYEEMAVRLGTCRLCLRRARRRLVEGRGTWPLYDSDSWVQAWERGLAMLLDVSPAGTPPGAGADAGADGGGGGWNGTRTRPHIIVADRPARGVPPRRGGGGG